MKLRQKLAMVLATAMVVTAVPVTTMAASTNSFSKTLSVADGTEITTGLHLIVDYTDEVGNDEFYLTTEDFDFDEDKYKAGVKVYGDLAETKVVGTAKWENDEVKVVVTAKTEKLYIPVFGTVDKGTPSITVDAVGSFATTSTLTFGEVDSDTTLKATVDKVKTISIDETTGTIGDIVIEELVAGSLAGLVDGDKITITLPNKSDLKFTLDQSDAEVTGVRGQSDVVATVERGDDDKVIEVTIVEASAAKAGTITISGITVEPEGKTDDFEEGEVEVAVEADKILDETDLVVAEIVEKAVKIEVEDEETIVAGLEEEKVTVVISQAALKSLDGDTIYFEIDGAQIVDFDFKDSKMAVEWDAEDMEDDGYVDEFQFVNLTDEDEYEIDLTLRAKAGTTGDITLTAESRGLEDDVEIKLGEAVAPFEVEKEVFVLKTDVRDQVGGKLVLKEAEAEDFDNTFYIAAEGLSIEDAKVKVTDGDVEISSSDKDGVLKVEIKRQSDEASEITISDIKVSADSAILEGKYDLYIYGTAVSTNNKEDADKEKMTISDFFSTTNAVEAEQAEVVLKVGDANYTVDGDDKKAEIAPFIDPATNRTMAPVRAVAEAFGCELDFFFPEGSDQLVITLTKGNKHVQFQNGSNIMVVDGGQFIMSATAQIKDGYTFVPVAFLAQALGINYTWDGATQTIVFGN